MKLPHPIVTVAFLASFIGYAVSGHGIFESPDISWHVAAGDYILAHGIPKYDPWSFSAGRKLWFNISWLWDVGLSLIMTAFGAKGIYFFTAAFGAFNIAVAAWCLKARGNVCDTYLLVACAMLWLAQGATLIGQPILMTFLLCAVFHHIMHSYRQDGVMDRRRTLLLVALTVLWVNTHGGFVAGFSVFVAYGVEAFETGNRPFMRVIGKLIVLCGLACFINPYHIGIVPAVLETFGSVITPYLNDWHAYTFGLLNTSVFVVFFILSSNPRDPKIRIADKLLAFTWLIAGLGTMRNIFVFAFLSFPYLAYNLQELARAAQRERFKADDFVPSDPTSRLRFALFAAVVSAAMLIPFVHNPWLEAGRLSTDPKNLAPLLKILRPDHAGTRFINDYNLGGYLVYDSQGTWPVFADGRSNTAYSEEVLKDVITFNIGGPLEPILKKYQAAGIIVAKNHRRANPPPKGWKKIFDNGQVVAYVEK